MNPNERFCCFCEDGRFNYNTEVGLPGIESVVYKDGYVFAIPDIAPFVEGHYLIVSEKHLLCFGESDSETRLSLIKAKAYLENSNILKGRRLLCFEHGSASGGSKVCIEHAHTHILPITAGVDITQIDNFISGYVNNEKIRMDRESIALYAKNNQPYVYYEIDDESWMYPVSMPLLPQFSRRLIAYILGSSVFRWGDMCKLPEFQEKYKKSMYT
jgi:diadenosine tetraphosphate (Ap4A) HIT family hydrolase